MLKWDAGYVGFCLFIICVANKLTDEPQTSQNSTFALLQRELLKCWLDEGVWVGCDNFESPLWLREVGLLTNFFLDGYGRLFFCYINVSQALVALRMDGLPEFWELKSTSLKTTSLEKNTATKLEVVPSCSSLLACLKIQEFHNCEDNLDLTLFCFHKWLFFNSSDDFFFGFSVLISGMGSYSLAEPPRWRRKTPERQFWVCCCFPLLD